MSDLYHRLKYQGDVNRIIIARAPILSGPVLTREQMARLDEAYDADVSPAEFVARYVDGKPALRIA